jgi:hypothetical protein
MAGMPFKLPRTIKIEFGYSMKKHNSTTSVSIRMSGVAFLIASSNVFAQVPSGYYDSVNTSSASALHASLHEIIDDHTRFPYTSSSTDTWDILELADQDPDNNNNVIDIYKNASYTKEGEATAFTTESIAGLNHMGSPMMAVTTMPTRTPIICLSPTAAITAAVATSLMPIAIPAVPKKLPTLITIAVALLHSQTGPQAHSKMGPGKPGLDVVVM